MEKKIAVNINKLSYSTFKSFALPVVPLTTSVVTVGLTAETVPGETRRTPPMGTVRRMVPGCPGAPFRTT